MPSKPMVLVVDDTESVRKLLAAELAQDDRIRVEQARNGAEGLEKAVSPDCAVIVLDMILPDTDGLQFIDQLRIRRLTRRRSSPSPAHRKRLFPIPSSKGRIADW